MENSKIIRTRASFDPLLTDTGLWPALDEHVLGAAAEKYRRNSEAIRAYFKGDKLSVIARAAKMDRSEIRRLRNRCLLTHPDGRIFGFRACAPYSRTGPYTRVASLTPGSGMAGAFKRLLDLRPELKTWIEDTVSGLLAPGGRNRDSPTAIHDRFLKLCRKLGLTGSEYPLNTVGLAERSLARHIDKLKKANPEKSAKVSSSSHASRKMANAGKGHRKSAEMLLPSSEVQCDGHKVDLDSVLLLPNPKGGFTPVLVERLWLLTIIDVISRAILGYHIAIGKNYSEEDVFQCVRNAVIPWEPPKLTINGLAYSRLGGMPSGRFPEMEWVTLGEIKLDNCLANRAQELRTKLRSALGAVVNFGAPSTPESRGIQERFFRTFAATAHRLPNTTGSSADDPRRSGSQENAVRYSFTIDHLHQVAAVVITNYNGTPHAANAERSPLDQLEYYFREKRVHIPQLPEERRKDLDALEHRVQVTVCGSLANGVRPYINFKKERYTNDALANGFHFVGQKLMLIVNRNEISTVRAVLLNGESLGCLAAVGIWRNRPHSLFIRKQFNHLRARRKLVILNDQVDPVQVLEEHWKSEAATSRAAATKLARLKQQQTYVPPQPPVSGPPPNAKEEEPEDTEPEIPRRPRTVIII